MFGFLSACDTLPGHGHFLDVGTSVIVCMLDGALATVPHPRRCNFPFCLDKRLFSLCLNDMFAGVVVACYWCSHDLTVENFFTCTHEAACLSAACLLASLPLGDYKTVARASIA